MLFKIFINGNFILKLGIKYHSCCQISVVYIHAKLYSSFVLLLNASPHCQFMNQTRQGMSMKMENMGNPAMRPGMQPGMSGQVINKYQPLLSGLIISK